MPEKSRVFKQTLVQKGIFNFKDLYDLCRDWLSQEGYDVYETKYKEKITAGGKEVQIEWTAKKKVSDYFRNIIGMQWLILGMNETEAEIEGKKVKTDKGELKIVFTADLEKDYEQKWEDQPAWKFLRGVYDKYVIRTTAEEYEDRLAEKVAEFVAEVKAFLSLKGV